jgi:fermentation-respiration switch protein FrsA (DUF1100 family)
MGLLNTLWGLARKALIASGGLATLGFALLVSLQRKLVYVPSLPGAPRDVYPLLPDDPRLGLASEELWLRASDGVKLHAWLLSPKATGLLRGPTLLFFQENAGNIAHRLPNVKLLVNQLACNVLLLSYRGFGRSEGRPSEAGLLLDAQAALEHVRGRPELDASRVVLFGRSLGGAVAAALAAATPDGAAAVVLENTFTSIPEMAGVLMPALGALVGPGKPLRALVLDKWATLERIARIRAPVLLISSGRDEMVPPAHMRRLYAARTAAQLPSEWLELPHASHMDAWQAGGEAYWGGLRRFLDKQGLLETR